MFNLLVATFYLIDFEIHHGGTLIMQLKFEYLGGDIVKWHQLDIDEMSYLEFVKKIEYLKY